MEKQFFLDSISLWTIFEYLPISSYLSILLTCKEWNNKLINLNKFKENKIFITTLISEITKIKLISRFYDRQNELQNLVCNKYKNNITAIFYLLSKLVDYKTFIFEKCNFRNNKLIILNSFINENGECILRLISDKTLQRDKEILLNAYKHNNEYGRRRFVNSCIPTEYYLDYNFCYSMLQICKAKTDIHLIQLIKNLESIKDYFKNIKISLNTLININKEILNEEFISILILEGNITKQQLKYYFEMNNELLNKINNTKLIYEFIKKRNFLITTFYKKLCKEDLNKIFSENPFTFKNLMNYEYNCKGFC
ncbi:hypothetical protein ABK040_006891 [Willaertia magna]